MHISRSNL